MGGGIWGDVGWDDAALVRRWGGWGWLGSYGSNRKRTRTNVNQAANNNKNTLT